MVTDWPEYLDSFHRSRPGITEAVLSQCVDDAGQGPYSWLTAPIIGAASVVDVGCGSAPTGTRFGGWVGVDMSMAELAMARESGRGPLVRGRAEALPFADGCVEAVVAAMSLMVVDDPAVALAEAARLLEPDGRLALLVPAGGPLTVSDKVRYVVLLAALGRSAMQFPHQELSRSLTPMLASSGFDVVSDEDRRFGLRIGGPDAADLFVSSLYAPGVSADRLQRARRVVRLWGRRDLGVPLRRVIAVRRR